MASLQKRGKYYYGRWQKVTKNGRKCVKKSLGIKYKPQAEEALEKLEKLEEMGAINPYSPNFDPQAILKERAEYKNELELHVVVSLDVDKKEAHVLNVTAGNNEGWTIRHSTDTG
jgi:DNA-binding Lrp family transcriptional regulator